MLLKLSTLLEYQKWYILKSTLFNNPPIGIEQLDNTKIIENILKAIPRWVIAIVTIAFLIFVGWVYIGGNSILIFGEVFGPSSATQAKQYEDRISALESDLSEYKKAISQMQGEIERLNTKVVSKDDLKLQKGPRGEQGPAGPQGKPGQSVSLEEIRKIASQELYRIIARDQIKFDKTDLSKARQLKPFKVYEGGSKTVLNGTLIISVVGSQKGWCKYMVSSKKNRGEMYSHYIGAKIDLTDHGYEGLDLLLNKGSYVPSYCTFEFL
jgi:hypothetical protein